jgi:hypothetical protein
VNLGRVFWAQHHNDGGPSYRALYTGLYIVLALGNH